MCKVQTLRAFVKQRLSAAAEEIMELFERTLREYEDEIHTHNKLLATADVQQLSGSKEEVPTEQQEWRPSLDQEDPPELPHIKEEQEELWISWEGELHRGLEEADITEFTVTPVKSEEDDEENPQSLHQSQPEENRDEHLKSEADGEDCGGPEPDRNLNPDHLQPDNDDETSHSSEPETDDSCDKEDVREPQSDLNRLQNNEEHVSDVGCDTVRSQKHNGVQTGVKPFSCSVCGKRYHRKNSLTDHMRLHSEGKRFSCSVCNKTFQWRRDVVMHMRIHTGEKPFSCSFCGKRFAQNGNLTSHLRGHTGEKPFACSICKKSFADSSTLTKHMKVHTREKSFSCSVCSETFSRKEHLKKHFTIHAGEKSATTRVRSHGGETA